MLRLLRLFRYVPSQNFSSATDPFVQMQALLPASIAKASLLSVGVPLSWQHEHCLCSRWDSNPHPLSGTRSLVWRVYQFRHRSISYLYLHTICQSSFIHCICRYIINIVTILKYSKNIFNFFNFFISH